MAHPRHGFKPEAEKARTRCNWSSPSGWILWKLQRRDEAGRLVIHPNAGDKAGPTLAGPAAADGIKPAKVREWEERNPSWEAVPA